MSLFPLIILLAATVAVSPTSISPVLSAAPTAASCPAPSPRATAPITYAITHAKLARLKRPKLDALTPADVQPLNDGRVCEALDEFYASTKFAKANWHRAYYKTGGYYMASVFYTGASHRDKTGVIRRDVRPGHVAIFSGKLRLVIALPNKL